MNLYPVMKIELFASFLSDDSSTKVKSFKGKCIQAEKDLV